MNRKLLEGFADFEGHDVHFIASQDPDVRLQGFVAFKGNHYDMALGGTRLARYHNVGEAITDALRLATGMQYKSAMAGLPLDGAKAVLIVPPDIGRTREDLEQFKTLEYFREYAAIIDSFKGRYRTGEDVNISEHDVDLIARYAKNGRVAGLSWQGGDPSPITAEGVMHGLRAWATWAGVSLAGLRASVQGAGKVGSALVEKLAEAGVEVRVTDIEYAATSTLVSQLRQRQLNVKYITPESIYDTPADIFVPCAKGAILDAVTIPKLSKAGVVVVGGSANNQLATWDDGSLLHTNGITYLPDYVINAGGLINVSNELPELAPEGYKAERALAQVEIIERRITEILTRYDELKRQEPIHVITHAITEEKIGTAKQ